MLCSAQLKSHGKNVIEAVNAAVNSLDKIDVLNSILIDLGHRHDAYGAKIQHFPVRK
jgi:hemoglobin-like flavoprotein